MIRSYIIAIPYKDFKSRIRKQKPFEKAYKIEILEGPGESGVLYMTKKGTTDYHHITDGGVDI